MVAKASAMGWNSWTAMAPHARAQRNTTIVFLSFMPRGVLTLLSATILQESLL